MFVTPDAPKKTKPGDPKQFSHKEAHRVVLKLVEDVEKRFGERKSTIGPLLRRIAEVMMLTTSRSSVWFDSDLLALDAARPSALRVRDEHSAALRRESRLTYTFSAPCAWPLLTHALSCLFLLSSRVFSGTKLPLSPLLPFLFLRTRSRLFLLLSILSPLFSLRPRINFCTPSIFPRLFSYCPCCFSLLAHTHTPQHVYTFPTTHMHASLFSLSLGTVSLATYRLLHDYPPPHS